jgi:hypothetical protein
MELMIIDGRTGERCKLPILFGPPMRYCGDDDWELKSMTVKLYFFFCSDGTSSTNRFTRTGSTHGSLLNSMRSKSRRMLLNDERRSGSLDQHRVISDFTSADIAREPCDASARFIAPMFTQIHRPVFSQFLRPHVQPLSNRTEHSVSVNFSIRPLSEMAIDHHRVLSIYR